MLARLSIRDIVLIERLDIEFSRGLAVLTGETGAGKSILLDAFALALGGRGDAGLVRHGVEQGQVTAVFDVPKGHPASKILADNGLEDTGEMILRRVQLADGRTRAFINDQAISVQTLKAVGSALVEIHGQHDERALVDASTHRRLLDAFSGLEKDVAVLEQVWDARRAANTVLDEHRAAMERAAREADYLRHAADELKTLAPKDGEETALAERRTTMMQGEKIAADLREAQDAVGGAHSPVPALSAAVRRLERRAANSPALVEPAVKAIDAAINALEEADQHLHAALVAADFDPAELERIEERLFALRAAARKYSTPVDGLAALAAKYAADVALIDAGAEQLKKLEAAAAEAGKRYGTAAAKLSAARAKSAQKLDKAVNAELKPLKLERATFTTQIESDSGQLGPQGFDRVEFWVQTNPGTRPGPLMKVASGGELARFLLALKVVLSDCGSAPTLVFDEIDTGVGGAAGGCDRGAAGEARGQGAGDGGNACAAGCRARQPASFDFQGRSRQGQARRHPRQRARRRPPPRGNRPHAGRRRDHRRGARGGGTAVESGDGVGPLPRPAFCGERLLPPRRLFSEQSSS
jgi:DNA repair protein RecN (Recombination protein N)